MDLMRARVALRERPLLDVLDLAVRFCAGHAGAYTRLSAVVLVPGFAISWCASRLGGWWVGWTATWMVTAFAGAPFVALASRLVFADTVRTREALGAALRAIPRLIAMRLLQALALAGSLLVLGLPWLWLGTVSLFVVEVLVLEQSGVGGALVRARRVAIAHFPDAALTMLLLVVAPVGAAMLGDVAGREILEGLLELRAPPSIFHAGGSWLALVGWWITVPLLETARFFVYLDIRTRAEGWDIQTRFAAIAARSEAERSVQRHLGAERAGQRRLAVGGLVLLGLLAVARPARAALDPTRAQADVDAALHDGDYSFCRAPRAPLSAAARELCPHASAISACEGFAADCAAAAPPPPSAPSWASWPWSGLTRTVLGFAGAATRILVWLLVAALGMAILVPVLHTIVRARRGRGRKDPSAQREAPLAREPDAVLPSTTDEELLLSRGDALARAGRSGAALQHYLAASLRALDKRGSVRMARDRTNGEYVRGCTDAEAGRALREIVREVDRVQFGGEEATPEGVARASQRALALVRALPVFLALALAFLPGCGGNRTMPRAGDDPAGGELFRDVLRRQGVDVAPLGTSLDSLALPDPGEEGPAVVVDLERTELDDETRDHLVEWVEAGGVLVLAGRAAAWPRVFGAADTWSNGPHELAAPVRGALASGAGLSFGAPADRVASFEDGTTYAAARVRGEGRVLGIASDELMTNAGLARPGNAAAMVSILSNVDRLALRLAAPEDGLSPPSSPVAALRRAGLGMGLVHVLLAVVVLVLAVGARLARPRPAVPPRRRAFAEHVAAVGALYARTRSAPHALAAYARFADDRLRARMPRGSGNVPAFLASRARLPLESCQRLWTRAVQAMEGAPARGDELAVLSDLSSVYAAAMAQATSRASIPSN